MSATTANQQNGTQPERTHNGVSRNEVADIQRMRILSAMVSVAAELGYIGAAVAPVVARAGVSRRTFYELFEGREDCFLAAFDWGVEQARATAVEAYGSQRSWRERVRHALATLLSFLDSEPELAQVLVVEALAAGKLVLERRSRVMRELTAALDSEAPRRGGASEAPLLTAEGIVGGAFSVIHARLLERLADVAQLPLTALHGQIMALIALPYLGPRAAGEEITRAAPEIAPRRSEVSKHEGKGRLLERFEMRLTYRTVRCLMFIGEHPGASNREIAKGAEIPDEGQASKLLGRLMKLDLISNSRPPGPGQPNRWTLTVHGEQVLTAVQSH